MYCAWGFPPGIPGVEYALGPVANLRGDGAGYYECHYAIGVEVRRGAFSRRVGHLHEDDVSRRLTRKRLLNHIAPRCAALSRSLLGESHSIKGTRCRQEGEQDARSKLLLLIDFFKAPTLSCLLVLSIDGLNIALC